MKGGDRRSFFENFGKFVGQDQLDSEYKKVEKMPGGEADYYRYLLETKTNPDDLEALKRIGRRNVSVWVLKEGEY